MPWKSTLLVAALGFACRGVEAATATLAPGAILVAPGAWSERADLAADAEAVLTAIASADAEDAIARLFAHDDPYRFEPLASRVIDALQTRKSTRAARRVLDALSAAPVRLFRRHEETAGDWFVPLYDVPGRAASALRGFDQLLARKKLVAALQQRPEATLAAATAPPALLAEAILQLDDVQVAALVPHALAMAARLPGEAWAALARRRPQSDVLRATVRHAAPLQLLPLLQELPSRMAPADALEFLEAALAHEPSASAAVLALGELAPRSPAASRLVEKQLASSRLGASAAAALARDTRLDRLERIDHLLAAGNDPLVIAHLALALRLDGSDAAVKRLHRLLSDPRLPARTKAELQR